MSAISLEQLLASRDARVEHQQQLLALYPGASLVCLTVQLPGPVKRNPDSLLIGGAGLAALLDKFGSVLEHVQVKDLETGYEAYLAVHLPQLLVKKRCCEIEETHPLGRLMDLDVIGPDGPVERAAVGREPRKCLLCALPARVCMRAHTHTAGELLDFIHKTVALYADE
ncbi:MAG: citrate lyase holo-[Bacteroidales bacterium]|nr:citrate lyase holo-[acyl-carrier protein] synthase [Bacteroidales bacterium]